MKTPLSVRTYLLSLIIVALTPLLAFSAFLVIRSAQHEQEIMAGTVRNHTRAAVASIERELSDLRGQLFVIASAERIEPANFAAFYARASAITRQTGLMVTLSAPDGKELLSTGAPPGAALPENTDREAVRRVAQTGLPYVSDLTVSPVTHLPIVTVSVPVMRQGSVGYVVSMDVLPAIARVVARQVLPPNWLATVIDRHGYIIARSRDAKAFVGQSGRPEYLARVNAVDEGSFPAVSLDGEPIYIAYAHVKPAGWVASIGIPQDVLYAPVRRSTEILILAGAATLAVALLLARLIGRRMSEPIVDLAKYAEEVGRGAPIGLLATRLRETDTVARSLYRASENLRQTAEAQQKATEELRQSELRYRGLVCDLGRVNEDRKQLLHQTVLAQEAERNRIARELHDSLGQYLTALRLGLSAIEPHCGAAAEAARQLSSLKGLTTEVGRELNRIAWELRPTVLDDLGLQTATAQYLEAWGERSNLVFDLQIDLGDRRLPQPLETTLYRVLQEAITNIVKHASAERVGVILDADGQAARLIVEDDGAGFSLDHCDRAETGTRHLGLLGMRERLALVNGTLEVESSPGSGTTLFARIPL